MASPGVKAAEPEVQLSPLQANKCMTSAG